MARSCHLCYNKDMKISITDQFLWAIYESGENLWDVYDFFRIKTFQEIITDQSFWKNLKRKKRKKQFSQFINYLKKKGYIKIKENEGLLLTSLGKEKSLLVKPKLKSKNLKKRKDNKWIMVVFDIPENKRKWRDNFRKFLIGFGFQKFQKSIWVCPYDVIKEVREIINIYSLDRFIKIFIVQEINV